MAPAALSRTSPPGNARAPRFRDGFVAGLDYLFAAEHDQGGWPQIYPLRPDYSRHITFNDGATVNVALLLEDVASHPGFAFVDEARRKRARQAVDRTVQMILTTQIRVGGRLTAWVPSTTPLRWNRGPHASTNRSR